MIVYRITLIKFADKLSASGNPARWNSGDIKMIYTAGTRALACLENIVHRSSLGLLEKFRIMMIEIPDDIVVKEIKPSTLSDDWHKFDNYPETQRIGDQWIKRVESAVLKVPSAIIPEEFNYLINPLHKDFDRIKYLRNDPFTFDSRIKE